MTKAKSMSRPLLVWEDTGPGSRQTLFRLFGVSWEATRYAWLSPLTWLALGAAIAFAEHAPEPDGRILDAAVYAVLLYVSNVLHTLGHIAAARLAKAPMAVNVLTSTRDVNVYVQPGGSAHPTARFIRALGGPAANLLGGGVALAASQLASARWPWMLGWFNLAVGLWTLAPVPSLDGWVLWRTMLRRSGPNAA